MLPTTLQEKIRTVWGPAGEKWISSFDEMLRDVSARWGLSNIQPFPDLSYNFVAQAMRGGEPVVLKLAVDAKELASEANALAEFDGDGTAQLIQHEGNAVLLERLQPGVALRQTWTQDRDDQFTEIGAQMMQRLWRPATQEFANTAKWLSALQDAMQRNQLLPKKLVDKAIQLADDLEQQIEEPVLLHGDLHHGNILSHGPSYKAIDPKGVIGDKAFEAGTWVRNPCDRILQTNDLAQLIERRLQIISDITHQDLQKLRAWSFVVCILSAVWSAEDEGGGWDEAIACAQALN